MSVSLPPTLCAGLRRLLYLRRLHWQPEDVRSAVFRLAGSFGEREQAFDLVQQSYARNGLDGGRAGARFSVFHLLPTTSIFVALRGGRVVGTLSLIEDTPLGVPMEQSHPAEVQLTRETDDRFAEIGVLALAPGEAGQGVPLMLYGALFRWARRHRHVRRLLIAVHPQIRGFFESVLLFRRLGPVRRYEALAGVPSVALGLDLATAADRYRAVYDRPSRYLRLPGQSLNLYGCFCADRYDNLQLPEPSRLRPEFGCVPPWHDDELRRIFGKYGREPAALPRAQRRVLLDHYPTLFAEPRGEAVPLPPAAGRR